MNDTFELLLLARRRAAQADELLVTAHYEGRKLTPGEADEIAQHLACSASYRQAVIDRLAPVAKP